MTWPLGDTKFLFCCSKIEKFCISVHPCNILYYDNDLYNSDLKLTCWSSQQLL